MQSVRNVHVANASILHRQIQSNHIIYTIYNHDFDITREQKGSGRHLDGEDRITRVFAVPYILSQANASIIRFEPQTQ